MHNTLLNHKKLFMSMTLGADVNLVDADLKKTNCVMKCRNVEI